MPQDKKKQQELPPGFIDPFKKKEELPVGFVDPKNQTPAQQVNEIVKGRILSDVMNIPGVQGTISTISPALDFISRPSYSAARFADALADDSKGILDAVSEAWDELTGTVASGTRKKITFSDVIKRRTPEFALENPKATEILGFVGDVIADPTSWLGVGAAKNGILVGGRTLTKATTEVLEEGLKKASTKVFIGKNGTLEIVEKLPTLVAKAEKAEERLLKRAIKPSSAIKDESKYFTKQISTINRKVNAEQELQKAGYFDAVRDKQVEIEAFLNKLAGVTDTKVVETIAKNETLQDLKRVARSRLPDEMFQDEVRERLNQRMQTLVKLDPKLADKFFEPKGVYLKIGAPFGKQKDLVRIMGLEGISNRVKAISAYMETVPGLRAIPKGARILGETFSRNFNLPTEYIQLRDELENELGYLTDELTRTTRKLFKGMNQKDRDNIGEAMHWIDDETRRLEEIRVNSGDPDFRTLTDGEAAQITQQGMDKFLLNADQRAIVARLQQDYKEAALLEMRANLLKNNLLNYSPRGYEIIENADEMSLITRGKYGSAVPQPYLSSSHSRKFLTKAEAEAAGLVPELDAALLYAHRILSSKRALAIQHFKDSVTEVFGAYNPKSRIAHTGILPTTVLSKNLPERVVADMKMIGEAVLPSGTNPTVRQYIRAFDRLQSLFKRGATTLRPSFAPKQLISNTFQSAMISGIKAFKALDPRVAIDAAILMLRKGRPLESLPPVFTNFLTKRFTGNDGLDAILAGRAILSKHFGEEVLTDVASQFKLRNVLGQEFTGQELIQLARENGIFRGFDTTGEAFSQKLEKEILKEQNSFKNVVGVLGKVWNHSSMMEDYSRMMLFLNGMRMGYTARDASKLVNKALFDYSRGLSDIEKTWFRRIIPFYSFQRFALPFVLKNALAKPNQVATIEKLMRTTEKLLLTGESLNEGEIHTFNEKGNNFLLEQPILLRGFDDKEAATLNILNNLTPYDVLNLHVYDKEGNIDVQRTIEKTFLAALTPFLKVPLQAVIDKDFFTGKTIEQAAKMGNVEGSIGKILPDFAKDLMSWETAKNHVTGETSVYINPFMTYYLMQFFPPLRDIVKAQEDVEYDSLMGPLEASMNLIYEIGSPTKSKDVDLEEMNIRSIMRKSKDIEDIKSAMIRARIEGRDSEFEERVQEAERYIRILGENQKVRGQFDIRGQGLSKQQTIPGVPAEIPEDKRIDQQYR